MIGFYAKIGLALYTGNLFEADKNQAFQVPSRTKQNTHKLFPMGLKFMQKNHKKTWVTLFMNSSYTRVYKVNI